MDGLTDCQLNPEHHLDTFPNDQCIDQIAVQLENVHVHAVYEEIADHFSHTRHTAWPKVAKFVSQLKCTDLLLDVGSGNGKNLLLPTQSETDVQVSMQLQSCVRIASDMAFNLLSVCCQKGLQSVQANCLQLPFTDNAFDAVLCIAVIHHLANAVRRGQALQEIERILRPTGRALVYVWAFEQKKDGKASVYISNRKQTSAEQCTDEHDHVELKTIGNLPIHRNRTAFKQQDMLVPWISKQSKSSDKQATENCERLRYYHLFKEGELRNLVEQFTKLVVCEEYFDNGNWAILLQKL